MATPDGIEERHIFEVARDGWTASLSIVVLFVLLAAALAGAFSSVARSTSSGDGVTLTVEAPERIRSGEFFEMLMTVGNERAVKDAVLLVETDLWRHVTVNTVTPEPSEEGFRNGSFVLHFGALEPGAGLKVKIDGQINPWYPPPLNDGTIALADGKTVLAAVDHTMRVFP